MEAPSVASLTELLRRAPQACSGIVAISDNGDAWRVKPVEEGQVPNERVAASVAAS